MACFSRGKAVVVCVTRPLYPTRRILANVGGVSDVARRAGWIEMAVVLATMLVCQSSASADVTSPPTGRWVPLLEREGMVTLRNQRALPRVWLVGEVRPMSARAILKTIRGESRDGFDPRQLALVEVDNPELRRLGAASPEDAARLISYADGRISVETRSASAAFLVVSESYFPGWEAMVDGKPAPIYQTNYVLQGVPVPAGIHRVELRYRTAGAATGLVISLGTLALLAGMMIYSARRRRRGEPPPSSTENKFE